MATDEIPTPTNPPTNPPAPTRPLCSHPDCPHEARTRGLCNNHYVENFRRITKQIQEENIAALRKLGDPADYFCEGLPDSTCLNTPVRWWVRTPPADPAALCQEHSEEIIEGLRLDIKRLEATL